MTICITEDAGIAANVQVRCADYRSYHAMDFIAGACVHKCLYSQTYEVFHE